MAKTAVALLNWNGEKILPTFLPSVVKYSQGADIYIIDNKSTDKSLDYVRKNFPQVKIIQLHDNYGFAGGYNHGLKQITADYFVLLNTDVEVTPNWLDPIIEFMENNPDIAAVQPKILSYHQKDTFEYAGASGGFLDKWAYPLARGRILDVTEKDNGQYDDIIPIFWASGAAMFIRAKDFFEAGGFDEDFFAHMEEIDLCWRLKNLGKQIYVFPQVKVYHLGGGTLNYHNPRKIFFNFRNSLYTIVKNMPGSKAFWLILWRMILDSIAAFNFLLTRPKAGFFQVIKAHCDFYKNLSKMLKKRAALKKNNNFDYKEVILKSIIWQYYIKKRRYFSQLTNTQ